MPDFRNDAAADGVSSPSAVAASASGMSILAWRLAAACVLTFAVLLGWTIALQWLGGAYSSELSGYPDEPAHYVTGLMIRDYIAAGFPATPLKFAEGFYIHYPKVAFGMWGPLLHVAEGGWMLLFSASRASVLVMMALITAALAFTLARAMRREFGAYAALAGGLALVSVQVVQTYGAMVMADNLCALMDFWALLCFGRFLVSQKRRDAALFGLFACLSVLTKGNGLALGLVPPLAVLLTRRFELLKQRNFWLPAGMVLVLVGPWQYFSMRLLTGIAERRVDLGMAATYFPMLVRILGPWLLPVALLGLYDRVIRRFRTKDIDGRWAALAVWPAAFWIFHTIVPSGAAEPRYVVAVVAPIVMFFAAGLARLAVWIPWPGIPLRIRTAALAGVAVCVFGATAFAIPRKASYGFVELADALVARPELRNTAWLVSSEGEGEGQLIAEVAMRDQRPGHFLLRASKALARSDWQGDKYELLRPTPEETMAYLESVPVRLLVMDRNPAKHAIPHHRALLQVLERYPERWRLLAVYPGAVRVSARDSRIEVYRLVGQENRPVGKIQIDLKRTLGRLIER